MCHPYKCLPQSDIPQCSIPLDVNITKLGQPVDKVFCAIPPITQPLSLAKTKRSQGTPKRPPTVSALRALECA